jgi:hypothetical protein
MRWLRSNIRHGTRLALLALVVQFALWFGHAHGFTAQAALSIHSSQQQQPAPGRDSDQHPDDFCAICAAVALTGTAMAATPPALPVPQAFEFVHPRMGTPVLPARPARTAFQSRAPPLS